MVLKAKDTAYISSGDVSLKGYTVEDSGEVFEPQPVKLRKGPYNIHMSVLSTPSEFTVQQIKVEKRRPAILGPEKFADMQSIKLDGITSLEELRKI